MVEVSVGGGGGDGQVYREERPGGVAAAVAAAADRMRTSPPPNAAAASAVEAVVAPKDPAPQPEVVVPAIEAPAPIPVLPGLRPRLESVISPPAVPAVAAPVQEETPDPVQALSAKVAELEARLAGTPSGAPAAPGTETNTETDVVADLTKEQVAQIVADYRAKDETCVAWRQEWLDNQARIAALVELHPVTQVPVKGILVDNARKIQALKGVIDPQALGLNLDPPDEVDKHRLQGELKELERDNRDALREHRELTANNDRLRAAYEARVTDHVNKARTETANQAAATRESREEIARQTAATSDWNSALKEHTTGMAPGDRDFVHRELLKEAHAYAVQHDGAAPDDFKAFMNEHMVELRARVIARQSRVQGQNVQDRQVRQGQPAPRDPASASPAPTTAPTGDTRSSFRAALQRAEDRTRRVVVR